MFPIIAALVALLIAGGAQAQQSCSVGMTQALVGAEPVIKFGGTGAYVATGSFGNAGGNTWGAASGWPDGSPDDHFDALTVTGPDAVCWLNGNFFGPMYVQQDAVTYYECHSDHGAPTGTSGSSCLPYHRTAAINPANTGGVYNFERLNVRGYGDGISLGDPLPYGTTINVAGSYFDYIHDDTFEDDHCSVNWIVRDAYVNSAFMLFASAAGGGNTCEDTGRSITLSDSWIRLYRFTHAYRERDGHGGLWKSDEGTNPSKTITNNRFLLGPDAGGQEIFPPVSEVDACNGNVVLWDGTEAKWNSMLAAGNGANLTAIQGGSSPPFPGCFTIVKREDRCGSCTSAEFLALSLPELGNVSWNQGATNWYGAHFGGGGGGCGIGPELALLLPLLGVVRRRRARVRSQPLA
jgi:hypothetical protein